MSKNASGKCNLCGVDLLAVTLHRRIGTKPKSISLCPNHAIGWAIARNASVELLLTFTREAPLLTPCFLCPPGAFGPVQSDATVHDFKFDKKSTPVEWPCCDRHARAFQRHRLTPPEVKKLIAHAGVTFMTHDDFYNEDGESIQSH